MNKRGEGLIALMFVFLFAMFAFGIASLISLAAWTQFDSVIQSLDNETVSPGVKEDISELGNKLLWADRLFMMFYAAFLICSLISSAAAPKQSGIFLFFLFGFIIIFTVIAAFISNAWTYAINIPLFISEAGKIPWINFFMKYFPLMSFLTILLNVAMIFLKRKVFTQSEGDAYGFE